MGYLALPYDHRLVDSADAARFLRTMKDRLESTSQFEGVPPSNGEGCAHRTQSPHQSLESPTAMR